MSARPEDRLANIEKTLTNWLERSCGYEGDTLPVLITDLWSGLRWVRSEVRELRAISGAAPPRGDRAYYDAASIYRELEAEDFSLAPSLDILEKALRAGRAAVPDEPPDRSMEYSEYFEAFGEMPRPPQEGRSE